MNIEDVRAFVAAVDTGSVGKAALKLNLTQPAISRRIQRLEEDLGISLLDRDSKPARPTRAGEAAYKRCVAVLRASEVLRQETRGAADLGPLRLGLTYAMSDSLIALAVECLRRECPEIQVRVSVERSNVLRRQVAEGVLDAAITASMPDRPLDGRAQLLGTEKVVVVAPAALRIKSRHIAELADQPWIINPDGCGFRTQLDHAFTECGRVLNVMAEIWGTAPQLSLIARGAGVGLVPERLLAESPHRDALKIVPIEDFQAAVAIWLVQGPDGPFDTAIGKLRGTVADLLASEGRRQGPVRNGSAKNARRA
jgi:DNA-binding transcriptional LysR family regulator